MNVQISPVLFYFVGALLVVFGALRAYYMGWQRREAAGDAEASDAQRARALDARRHMKWGLLWVIMGVVLVISTLMNARR